MKKKMIASLALLVALTGCSSINEGTVTDKHHYEGYYSTTFICSAYGSNGMCMVQVPITSWNPDRWSLDLEKGDEDGYVSVSETVFNQYSIGDYYTSVK